MKSYKFYKYNNFDKIKNNLIYAKMMKVLWYVYDGKPIYPSCKKVKFKFKKKSAFKAKFLLKTPTNILL